MRSPERMMGLPIVNDEGGNLLCEEVSILFFIKQPVAKRPELGLQCMVQARGSSPSCMIAVCGGLWSWFLEGDEEAAGRSCKKSTGKGR